MMKIAVISDLHVGLGARSKDLCPQPKKGAGKIERFIYDKKRLTSFQADFLRFLEKNRISADFLVIPGDVTDSGTSDQAGLASGFVTRIAGQLGIPVERVLFVPGNHDVDWTMFDKNDEVGAKWSQRYCAVGHKSFVFSRSCAPGPESLVESPYFKIWSFPSLLVVGYNSAWHDKPEKAASPHPGLADPEHLELISKAVLKIEPAEKERRRIFLVHHHSISFVSPIPRDPEYSLMINAEGLLDFLHQYKFDMLIHGHRHHPRFEIHSNTNMSTIPVLCAGSLSAEIDSLWAGAVANQFHMIQIDEDGPSSEPASGEVLSWMYRANECWVPCERHASGIHDRVPFGEYFTQEALDKLIAPFVEDRKNSNKSTTWRMVVSQFPRLARLPTESAEACFQRIAERLNMRHMLQPTKDLIVYNPEEPA